MARGMDHTAGIAITPVMVRQRGAVDDFGDDPIPEKGVLTASACVYWRSLQALIIRACRPNTSPNISASIKRLSRRVSLHFSLRLMQRPKRSSAASAEGEKFSHLATAAAPPRRAIWSER